MFEKILLAYSEKISAGHADAVRRVSDMLADREVRVVKSRELGAPHFRGADLVITVGGDGAVIRAAAFTRSTLLLAVNSEPEISEGALAAVTDEELDFIEDVLNGRFKTLKRSRAEVAINGRPVACPALNEVYVGAENQFHTSRYIIGHGGKEEEHRSSGVLVSTGSGSRAWYMAAGGRPFGCEEKRLGFIVREPFRGRRFNAEITAGSVAAGESVFFESRRDEGGIIALDANMVYDFNEGDTAVVRLSPDPLETIVREDWRG